MVNADFLINTSLIFYEDMFSSNAKRKDKETVNLIDKEILINTSLIFYKDMVKTKS